jgi:predicted regulator of Ras-like GTPase activity (Roadblock/LC7/MglB family)
MGEDLQNVLRSLRDVDGVVGSFVLDRHGELDARDLPDYFDSSALLEVAPRIERLYEAWKTLGAELETASLSFAEHKLHVRELNTGFLVVVSAAQVNAPALRMAIGMVSRRLTAALEARAGIPPQAAETRPSAAPPAPGHDGRPARPAQSASEGEAGKPRMYRGNIVR